jgi:hypothetical protein
MISVKIQKSDSFNKKYMATFYRDGKRFKTTHFGAKGMSDFTIHGDEERKQRYIARHSANENWNDYTSAGSLARYILWNKPTLRDSIADYKRRFNLSSA